MCQQPTAVWLERRHQVLCVPCCSERRRVKCSLCVPIAARPPPSNGRGNNSRGRGPVQCSNSSSFLCFFAPRRRTIPPPNAPALLSFRLRSLFRFFSPLAQTFGVAGLCLLTGACSHHSSTRERDASSATQGRRRGDPAEAHHAIRSCYPGRRRARHADVRHQRLIVLRNHHQRRHPRRRRCHPWCHHRTHRTSGGRRRGVHFVGPSARGVPASLPQHGPRHGDRGLSAPHESQQRPSRAGAVPLRSHRRPSRPPGPRRIEHGRR